MKGCGASIDDIKEYCDLCRLPESRETLYARYQIILRQREQAYRRIEEAKAVKLTFGKYAGKLLSEVPENYLQWLFENTKDETIRTACDFIMKHVTSDDVNLLAEFENLIIQTDTDREKLYANYHVKSNAEMTQEQLKDAIGILKKKLAKVVEK